MLDFGHKYTILEGPKKWTSILPEPPLTPMSIFIHYIETPPLRVDVCTQSLMLLREHCYCKSSLYLSHICNFHHQLQFEAFARAQQAATNPNMQHISSHLCPAQTLAITQSGEIHGMGMRQHQDAQEREMAFMQYKYQEAFMRRAAQPSATSEPEAGDDFYQPRAMVVKRGCVGPKKVTFAF